MIKKSFKPCRIKGSNSSVRCHAKSLAPERDSTRTGRCQTTSLFYASQARGRVGLSFSYEPMYEVANRIMECFKNLRALSYHLDHWDGARQNHHTNLSFVLKFGLA